MKQRKLNVADNALWIIQGYIAMETIRSDFKKPERVWVPAGFYHAIISEIPYTERICRDADAQEGINSVLVDGVAICSYQHSSERSKAA